MARHLTVNVAVVDGDGVPQVFEAGSVLPKWAEPEVGEHCYVTVDEPAPARKTASK